MIKKMPPKSKNNKKASVADAVNAKFNAAKAKGKAAADSKIQRTKEYEAGVERTAKDQKEYIGAVGGKEAEAFRNKAAGAKRRGDVSLNAGKSSSDMKKEQEARVYDPQLTSGKNIKAKRRKSINKSSAPNQYKKHLKKINRGG